MSDIYVVPNKTGWVIRGTSLPDALTEFHSKSQATYYARKEAKKRQCDVYIKNEDGTTEKYATFRPPNAIYDNVTLYHEEKSADRS